jgi:hypothetical protein
VRGTAAFRRLLRGDVHDVTCPWYLERCPCGHDTLARTTRRAAARDGTCPAGTDTIRVARSTGSGPSLRDGEHACS